MFLVVVLALVVRASPDGMGDPVAYLCMYLAVSIPVLLLMAVITGLIALRRPNDTVVPQRDNLWARLGLRLGCGFLLLFGILVVLAQIMTL